MLLHHQLLATQEVLLLQDQEDHLAILLLQEVLHLQDHPLAILLLQEVHPPPLQDMLVPHLQLTNKVPNPRHQDIPDLLLQATILDNLVLVLELDLQPIPIILHSLSLLTNLQLQEVSMDPTRTAEVDHPKDRAILVLHSDCVVLVN